MLLRMTPIPAIAVGIAQTYTGFANTALQAATAPFTTVHLGPGIDDVSLRIGAAMTVKGVEAQIVFLAANYVMINTGHVMVLTSPFYTVWDNWGFNNFFI